MAELAPENQWVATALQAWGVTPAPIFPVEARGIHGVPAFTWNFRCGERAGAYCTPREVLTNRDVQNVLDLAGVRVDIPSAELDGTAHPLLMRRSEAAE